MNEFTDFKTYKMKNQKTFMEGAVEGGAGILKLTK